MPDLENYEQLRVRLLGLGLEAYWSQFNGLKARLEGHILELEENIRSPLRQLSFKHIGLSSKWLRLSFLLATHTNPRIQQR